MSQRVLRALISIAAIVLGLGTAAAAQNNCVPFGGTIYAWHTKAWIGSGNFMVGRETLNATIVDVMTSFVDDGNLKRGTETATFDFGNGDKVDLLTDFVTEHMTDSASQSGVFHVNEIGTFANGAGRFKNAYGHFSSQGPFGPKVKLGQPASCRRRRYVLDWAVRRIYLWDRRKAVMRSRRGRKSAKCVVGFSCSGKMNSTEFAAPAAESR